MDPQSRPTKFSSARGSGLARFGIPGTLPRRRTGLRRVHFSWVERHDRLRGGQKPGGKVGVSFGSRCYRPPWWTVAGPRNDRRRRPSGFPGEFDWWGLGNRARRPLAWTDRDGSGGIGSVAILSAFHPTRLETRTKESNMRASHWAGMKPKGAVKARAAQATQVGSLPPSGGGAHHRPVPSASAVGRSRSVHAGTRKMVNYA